MIAKTAITQKTLSGGLAVLDIEGSRVKVAGREGMEIGADYTVVLRPEAAELAQQGALPCTVELSCFMGSYQNYHVRVGETLVKLTDPNPKNKHIYNVGDRCWLAFEPDVVHIL